MYNTGRQVDSIINRLIWKNEKTNIVWLCILTPISAHLDPLLNFHWFGEVTCKGIESLSVRPTIA